jgi:uncharacterized protein YdgA (DUF945 family)
MKKAVGIAAGFVVVVGVVATGGAWYTGTQLEEVLDNGVANANAQFDSAMVGPDGRAVLHLELASLERHLFSSTAHYRVQVRAAELGAEPAEFLLSDHIEHGPFPASRVSSLQLLPVMATSNLALQPSPSAAQWFAASQGQVPLTARLDIHYDGDSNGTVNVAPLELQSAGSLLTFSGLTADLAVGANAAHYALKGRLADLQLQGTDARQQPVQVGIKDFSFNLGGTRGVSGFYLGHNDVKLASLSMQLGGAAPVLLEGMTTTSLAQEAAASKSLYRLFQTQIAPQQQAAAAAGIPFRLQLSPADEQALNADAARLLSAKPRIELDNLSLKTANGEGRVSLAVDLTPVPLSATAVAPTFGPNIIGAVDAKVVLSKAMLADLGNAQAQLQGVADPLAIARNGQDFSDMVSGMAALLQLAKVEGDSISSQLHYSAGMVDFNGQRMTAPQFVASVLGRVGLGTR